MGGNQNNQLNEDRVELKRAITLLYGAAIIGGTVIGSGIFASLVGNLQKVRCVGLSLIMWIVCRIYNTLSAVCYAELGTTIPKSGGEYIYIKIAFGDKATFVCLWIYFVLICPVGIAVPALIFSVYVLHPCFKDFPIPETNMAFLAAVISWLNIHATAYVICGRKYLCRGKNENREKLVAAFQISLALSHYSMILSMTNLRWYLNVVVGFSTSMIRIAILANAKYVMLDQPSQTGSFVGKHAVQKN